MKTIVLEIRDGNNLYDANGLFVCSMTQSYVSVEQDKSKQTIELVKLGVPSEDIIKLKHQGLL